MARYLITGIAGFIGSTLAHALVEQGHEVRGIDNLSTGTLENLADIRHAIYFEKMDLQDVAGMQVRLRRRRLRPAPGCARLGPAVGEGPVASHESNINGTLNLLIAARDAKVAASSMPPRPRPMETSPPSPSRKTCCRMPLSPYAVQKLTCEYYIQSFYRAYGLEGVCLRYFNIFGPRQAADSPYSGVIAQFTYKMMAGETPTIFGDGLTSRDFNYVDNAVSANLLACLAPSAVATGRVFNIGTGKSHTLNEVYAAIAGQLGFRTEPNYGPERAGDIKHSLADITRATTELGYQPKAHFHEGLQKTVDWYLAEHEKKAVATTRG